MSLYHYFANKNDLLDNMPDFVVGEFDLPSQDGDWKITLRESAISAHAILWTHPWACRINVSRPTVGPAALRYIDSVMGSLHRANFPPQMTHDALHAIFGHIYGFTLQGPGVASSIESLDREATALLLRQMAGEYPYITEIALAATHDHTAEFEFVLNLIPDGLGRIREAS